MQSKQKNARSSKGFERLIRDLTLLEHSVKKLHNEEFSV